MKKLITALALASFVAAAPGAAFASEEVPAEKAEQIRAMLTEQGYEVRKIEMEDGMFEAYVLKDGKKSEIYLDADFKVVKEKTAD